MTPVEKLEAAIGQLDDEQFCDRCAAGVTSPEHHEKCVVTGFAEDGESASLYVIVNRFRQGDDLLVRAVAGPFNSKADAEEYNAGQYPSPEYNVIVSLHAPILGEPA